MNDCVFCKIVSGEIPSQKIYEGENHLVILDAFPTIKGQVLVIPKNHSANCLFDLGEEEYSNILLVAKKIANSMQKAFNPIKVGMVAEGLDVDHVHIKLYPLGEEGLMLKPALTNLSEEEMSEIAKKIADNL